MRILGLAIAISACNTTAAPHVLLDFTRPHGLFDAPFPADDLHPATVPFPDPGNVATVEQARALLADSDGFAVSGGVFFQISAPLDPAGLPAISATVTADSSVFLVGIGRGSPDYGVRYPLEVSFEPTPSSFGAPNLLALLPLQGVPLRPGSRYAAVVTTALHAASGDSLAADDDVARFPDAATALADLGIEESRIAGVTAFTTGSPGATLAAVHDAVLAGPLPTIDAPLVRTDLFADFCVYHTTIAMPDWQSGTPPFSATGGTWTFDATGAPIVQRTEPANLVVTIPRAPLPAPGYPLVVFVRTGGGGDRPLVDRGQQPAEGQPAIVPGEGPARYFARAGFAGIEVDGPLGGLRNTTGADEQFLTFNIINLGAMRDNIRESAIELDVLARVAIALRFDASDCPGAGSTSVGFDAAHLAIMGHSMGAWIAPLAVAVEPLFRVMILSGAGGSWIENIMYKQKPTPVYPVVSTLLRVSTLAADDPVMTFAQWALEPADPQVYGRGAPRQVLMMQGLVDDYILPRIANATSLALDLDLAGPELDTIDDPRLAGELALGPLLPLVGRATVALPATANVGPGVTAVVTQHPEDGIEDGHEVVFQTDPPKHEYQCFLASWLGAGTPSVPTAAGRDAPCP